MINLPNVTNEKTRPSQTEVSPKTFGFQNLYFQLKFPLDHQGLGGSSYCFGSSKSILSFEMTFRPSKTWESTNSFESSKTIFPFENIIGQETLRTS